MVQSPSRLAGSPARPLRRQHIKVKGTPGVSVALPASAADADKETVEAAWGFVKRRSARAVPTTRVRLLEAKNRVKQGFGILRHPQLDKIDSNARVWALSGNYYDQNFNNQDWSKLHERYLKLVDNGERGLAKGRASIELLEKW